MSRGYPKSLCGGESKMSYQEALEAAGAKVQAYKEFGSYQGDWWAKIGEDIFVHGSFGSCSGCDAFQSEIGDYVESCDDKNGHWGYVDPNCEDCKIAVSTYKEKLIAFGQRYLEDQMSRSEAVELMSRDLAWDHDAEEVVQWLKEV